MTTASKGANFIIFENRARSNTFDTKMHKYGPTYKCFSNNKEEYMCTKNKLLNFGLIIRVLKKRNGDQIYSPPK